MRTIALLSALLLTACSADEAAPTDTAHAVKHGPDELGAKGDAPGDHATMQHRFDDPEKWAKVFDDPERDAWQKPADLVGALQIAPGATVADIGAGTGYFNPHLAKAVGPDGTVLAVDIEQSLVDHMAERAKKESTPQVKPQLGAMDDPKLPTDAVDLVLLVDTYHHIGDRIAYFGKVKEAMKDGGRLAIVDFKKDADIPVGPPPSHRLAEDKVQAELEKAGWTAKGSLDVLPYQYVLVFEK